MNKRLKGKKNIMNIIINKSGWYNNKKSMLVITLIFTTTLIKWLKNKKYIHLIIPQLISSNHKNIIIII